MSVNYRVWGLCVAVAVSGLCAGAQAGEEKDKPGKGERRPGKVREERRRPIIMMPGALDEVLESLSLDGSQRAQIDGIIREHRDKMRSQLEEARSKLNVQEEMAKFREEMRAAREAGDRERLEEIRNKMRTMFDEQKNIQTEAEKSMHDAIVAVLRPDQVATFEQAWSEAGSASLVSGRGVRSARELRRVVTSLGLTKEQEASIETVFEDYRRARRNDGQRDNEQLLVGLRSQVEVHLTAEQKAKLDRMLRPRERRGRDARGAAGTRRPPPGQDAPIPPGGDTADKEPPGDEE